MPICAPGTSVVRPGIGQTVVISTAAVEAVLGFLQPEVALILAPIIASLDWDTSSICGQDPPADPGLTAQDLLDAQTWGAPEIAAPAWSKIHTWFLSWYWFTLCQCAGATTPGTPVPSNPGNVVSSNPGMPTGLSGAACWDQTQTTQPNSAGNMVRPYATLLWSDGRSVDATSNVRILPTPLPTSIVIRGQLIATGPNPAHQIVLSANFRDINGTLIGGGFGNPVPSVPTNDQTLTLTPPAGAYQFTVDWNYAAQTPAPSPTDWYAILTCRMFCSGQSAQQPTTPCCPPDAATGLRLNQILGLLQAIFSGLPSSVTSYANGTVHAGLHDNGTISLAGAPLAIRVDITTDPATLGTSLGDPAYLFDRGFIVPIVNTAPVAGDTRLVYNPQLYILPQLTEQVGYSLHPGVIANITELTRGP